MNKFFKRFSCILCVLPLWGCAGSVPENLGVSEGKLSSCPNKPNCVASDATDERHAIAPFTYQTSDEQAWQVLKQVISQMPRTEIKKEDGNYLWAESTSKIFRFVDDIEFLLKPAQKEIALRSASRLGYGDLGVNRKRIENIRDNFKANLAE